MAAKTITPDALLQKSPVRLVAEMIGKQYGSLTVNRYAGRHPKNGICFMFCTCQCGKTSIASVYHLRSGRTTSCGCFRNQKTVARLTKHGYAPLHGKRMKSYITWQGMMRRCYNKNDSRYYHYGKRGIKVCERWHDFTNFLSDMREPQPGMSIERRDNDKDYCPENCIWIPHKYQSKNRRYNWKVLLDGEQITAREATRRLGLGPSTVARRLRKSGCNKRQCVVL